MHVLSNIAQSFAAKVARAKTLLACKNLKRRALRAQRNAGGYYLLSGYRIEYTDLLSLYMEYKDIFLHRIYHFCSAKTEPCIIDGGGCIGMSVLYFKKIYPQSHITCFEPDPSICHILHNNIRMNGMENVQIIQSGLAGEAGTIRFLPDGIDGGRMAPNADDGISVPAIPLSQYINKPVDFLKLNIEGQEWPVLEELEAAGKLPLVKEMVVEYHGWPQSPQALDSILALLNRNGYRYLIHDFDTETCASSKPPFHLDNDTTWFCLIYGRRISA